MLLGYAGSQYCYAQGLFLNSPSPYIFGNTLDKKRPSSSNKWHIEQQTDAILSEIEG